jgi:tetratricopeptide (TPR) repeat protein
VPHASRLLRLALVILSFVQLSALAAMPVLPFRDDEVIEVLPLVTRNRPVAAALQQPIADAAAAARTARLNIAQARQTGDTRYWGRAQAVLAPWWNKKDAPVDIAVLQATVQQGRHEFEASREVLEAALARTPNHAQGWLNLAALERLQAHYPQALVACAQVASAGQRMYAQACTLETVSLQGQHEVAAQGLQKLIVLASSADQRSWLSSLLAEALERAGRDAAAALAYQRSLGFEPDLYTAVAYSDLLLRTGKSKEALTLVASSPETDAVLLRRAAAWKRLGDARWQAALLALKERTAELKRRGDDPTLHGRELALIALWLEDDAVGALALAQQNLVLQREPVDWWIALQSAKAAKDSTAVVELNKALRQTGLQDARLAVKP